MNWENYKAFTFQLETFTLSIKPFQGFISIRHSILPGLPPGANNLSVLNLYLVGRQAFGISQWICLTQFTSHLPPLTFHFLQFSHPSSVIQHLSNPLYFQLPTSNFQYLPFTSHLPPLTFHFLPFSHPTSDIRLQLQTSNFPLPILTIYIPPTTSYLSLLTIFTSVIRHPTNFPTSNFKLPTSNFQLPTSNTYHLHPISN